MIGHDRDLVIGQRRELIAGHDRETVPDGLGSVSVEIGRRMWVVVLAGIPTGVVVAGAGSRLAMLLLRVTSPGSVRGVSSDDGFEIGRVTVGGTYNLLMLGAAVGVIGAVAYLAVRPWLLGPRWLRRLTVAAASGAVVGSMLIHDDGIDFHLLQPLWLAISLFVALPALFGAAIAAAVDRVDALEAPVGRRRWLLPAVPIVLFWATVPVLVVATLVSAGAVVLGRGLRRVGGRRSRSVSVAVRGGWLTIALLGVVALINDITALA